MSERGQKIFKWIVWIIIASLLIFEIFRIANFVADPNALVNSGPITRTEWATELADGFGDENILLSVEDGEENTTGEYAAITAMSAIGVDRLSYLTEEEITDQTKIDLAVQEGVVPKKLLDDEISKEEADQIILNALDLYCDPDNYPEYFETEKKIDLINADRWNISDYNEETQTITATIDGEAPEVGRVITFTDEYGIAKAKHIEQVDEMSDNKYSLQVSNVDDVSEIFDSVSFSGTSDFNYLAGGNKESGSISSKTEVASNGIGNPFVTTVYAAENAPMMLAEWEWLEDKTALQKEKSKDTNKCDIEFNVEITDTEKNGEESSEVTSYISVKSNGVTKKYKYSIDNEGKSSFTADVSADNWPNFEFSENEKKAKKSDTSYMKDEMGVTANVKLSDFGISTSGYYQWGDPDDSKNYVEVLASADKININSSAKLSSENKYKIGKIPIPIAATAGVISIDLNVYLVVGASGEITIWYEIDDPKVGMNVSIANGAKPIHGCSNEDAGVRAEIELNGGFIGEAAVMVLDTVDLADPGVDARAYASASTIDVKDEYKVKEEYEGSSCVELKAQAPVVKIKVSAGEDSLLYALLDTLKVEASYNLVKKDSDSKWLKKITYHVEAEDDGTITVTKLEGSKTHEDVCTHITKKTKAELEAEGITDEVNKKVDEAEEATKSKLEQMIEDALEKWFAENCGGC